MKSSQLAGALGAAGFVGFFLSAAGCSGASDSSNFSHSGSAAGSGGTGGGGGSSGSGGGLIGGEDAGPGGQNINPPCTVSDQNADGDSDGFTTAQGDCNDCSAAMNPGA